MIWQRCASAQYSGRECIEVVGIPDNVNNNELEHKALTVFKKIGCEIPPRDLEACHRLRKNSDRVTVTFSHRKDSEQIMSVKKGFEKKNKNAGYWVNKQSIYIYKYKLMPL